MTCLHKKAGISAGLFLGRSVFRNAKNAEAIVEAHREHIHVLADPIERIAKQRVTKDQVRIVERFVGVTHEQVVVFETNRPIRREAIFKSDAHSAAPAGRLIRGETKSSHCIKEVKAIARGRRAALQVKQCRVPGIPDLAGEKTYTVNSGPLREGWI